MKPFFSILIPTRNRSELLVNSALKSVLNQTFKNFEVVICDNASTDNTRQRVEEIKDPRVRYVCPPEWIPKEHFFEFAFKQAHGEFSMIFCDDDYLTTTALEKAHHILSMNDTQMLVYSPACTYHYPNWHEASQKNILRIPPFSGRLFKIESATHLEMIFERIGIMTETPMVTDVFYRTSFVRSFMDQYGTIFPHGHMGDYNIACYTLSHTPFYLFLDEPLTVFGHWKENTSEQLHFLKTTMPEYIEWIEWITNHYIVNMPVKTYQWGNCVAATLFDMKKILNLPHDIDMAKYFHSLIQEIVYLELRGIDVSAQKESCQKAFKLLSFEIQKAILKAVENGPKYYVQNIAQALCYNPPNPVQSHRNLKLGSEEIRIKGDSYGFATINDAGKFYESFLADSIRVSDETNPSIEGIESTENYIRGITAIAEQYCRVLIIGSNNVATRAAANILGSKTVCIGDINFLLKGEQISPGVEIDSLDVLSDRDFECVVITFPDYKLSQDAPYKLYSEYIKNRVGCGKSGGAVVLRFEDIVLHGAVIKQIDNGSLDGLQLIDRVIQDGEGLVSKGDLNNALNLFSGLLERVNKIRGTLINNIAVTHANQGDYEKAEKLLSCLIKEDHYDGEATTNLEIIKQVKSQQHFQHKGDQIVS